MREKRICLFCKKVFFVQYKSYRMIYCSHSCANQSSAPIRTKAKIRLSCEYCKKDFFMVPSVFKNYEKEHGHKRKYCSQKCMGLANRKEKSIECLNCKTLFIVKTCRNKRKFCSNKCRYAFIVATGSKRKHGFWYENGYKVLYKIGDDKIREHRKIMEDKIGRKLSSDEFVHHINGILDDNRIENLQMMIKGEHASYHRKLEKAQGNHLFGGYHNN